MMQVKLLKADNNFIHLATNDRHRHVLGAIALALTRWCQIWCQLQPDRKAGWESR